MPRNGIVLRYGLFHGHRVPSTEVLIRLNRRGLLVLPGGGDGLLSWVELSDAARATVDALERGRGGQMYNIVEDEPVRFYDYAHAIAQRLGARAPRSVPMWLSRVAAPYAGIILGHTELPISNAKAAAQLDWTPTANYRDVLTQLTSRDE